MWRELLNRNLQPRLLEACNVAVVAIGDSSYECFNYAGKKLSNRLVQLGCHMLLPRADCDERHPKGLAGALDPWFQSLCQVLGKQAEVTSSAAPPAMLVDLPKYQRWMIQGQRALSDVIPGSWRGLEPFTCQVVNIQVLSPDDDPDTYLIELSLPVEVVQRAGPSSVIALQPQGSVADAQSFIEALQLQEEPEKNKNKNTSELSALSSLSLLELFTSIVDIHAEVTRSWLELLALHAMSPRHVSKLQFFCSLEGQEELYDYAGKWHRSILDVTLDFQPYRPASLPLSCVLAVLPRIRPREFSLLTTLDGKATLLWKQVKMQRNGVFHKLGLLTAQWMHPSLALPLSHVAYLQPQGKLFFPSFHAPGGLEVEGLSFYFLCTGTGIASFISAIRRIPPTMPVHILHGCRHPHVFAAWQKEFSDFSHITYTPAISGVSSSSSSSNAKKVYVQHLLRQSGQATLLGSSLCHSLLEGRSLVYYSGASKGAPTEIRQAVIKNMADILSCDEDAAARKLQQLAGQKRWQMEVWD